MRIAQMAFAAGAASLLAGTAWAGQINLSSRTTVINRSATTSVTTSSSETITSSTITRVDNGTSSGSLTETITITEAFAPATAAVSVEVSQDGVNYTSPFDNTLATGSLVQSVTLDGSSGINNVGANAGVANVSVASTAIIDGAVVTSLGGSALGNGSGGFHAAALALTPGFALQNSNANAIALMASDAFHAATNVNSSLSASGLAAIDIQQVDLNEYSPHGNTGAIGTIAQTVTVTGTTGINNVNANAGVANVSASHTSIVFTSDTGDIGTILAP